MTITSPVSVFSDAIFSVWKNRHDVTLNVVDLTAGLPSDEKYVEGWVRSKVESDNDLLIRERVAAAIVDLRMDKDKAIQHVAGETSINRFRRTPEGHLFIGGYQAKAAIREAISIAVNGGHVPAGNLFGDCPGPLKKSLRKWAPEHVMIPEHEIVITRNGAPLTEPDEVVQRFAHPRPDISAIVREEVCYGVDLSFQVWCDTDDMEKYWSPIWLLGQEQGIGAVRSMGRGRYVVTQWDRQA